MHEIYTGLQREPREFGECKGRKKSESYNEDTGGA
jgi:hypothetical protein